VKAAVLSLILMTVSHFCFASEPGLATVEEVLAVVGTTPILASDIELAALVAILEPEPEEPAAAYRSRLLDARIRLELQFRDLEESGLLFRLDVDAARARDVLTGRGGGPEALAPRLAAVGLSWPDLEELALRIAAAEAFVQQRLRARVSVSLEEIEAAYEELLVSEIAASGEQPPPLTAVRDRLAALLTERKLNLEIERWLARAAARQEVTRFSR